MTATALSPAQSSAVAVFKPLKGEIVDRDAIEIGELYERSNSSLGDAVIARLECGRRLSAKKASMAHGEWLAWIETNAGVLGFAHRATAARLIKAADRNVALTRHLPEPEAVKLSRQMWGNTTQRGASGTGDNEWFTPAEHIELARKMLGAIDLDPASHPEAQRVVGAKRFFTEADNGLTREWAGRVWLNPPYAQPAIGHFAEKMVAEVAAGRVTEAVMLTHNYTDTAWFQTLARAAAAICFTKGRIRFVSPAGALAAPTQGQAFFYFGKRIQTFQAHFNEVGVVMVRAEV